VQEIRGYSAVTPIPNTPPQVKGVINLRGAVVPVIDLRLKFGMAAVEHTKFAVIVVVAVGGKTVGLIVDGVSDVLNLTQAERKPPPDLAQSSDLRFVEAIATIGERLVTLLHVGSLVGEELALTECAA
jgi:purine-binding chemotaxis protein CheW